MSHAISPLDGRYAPIVGHLDRYFSEYALTAARCEVELRYLLAIDEIGILPQLDKDERRSISAALQDFSDESFARIREIEKQTEHDVKACEIYLRERLSLRTPNRIHFGLTSEDVNNLAYGLLLSRYRDQEQLPQLRRLGGRLAECVREWRAVAFPARTHGQAASPTTLGKELGVFLSRLGRQVRQLEALTFRGKLAGATGTHAAAVAAFPDVDWLEFSEGFVGSLGLDPNPCVTQVEDGDGLAEYFGLVARINNILLDLDLDLWEYVSRGDLVQRAVEREVGSSTMPHKVNPIRFENSEGNLTLSTALLHTLSDKLTRSRMQRDLSDSSVRRNIGVALAHAYLAVEQTLRGLERINVDKAALRRRIDEAPGVLSEAYQTILRTAGVDDPYELLRTSIRGRGVALADLHRWVDGLPVSDAVKDRLKSLRPSEYVGLASRLAERAAADAENWIQD